MRSTQKLAMVIAIWDARPVVSKQQAHSVDHDVEVAFATEVSVQAKQQVRSVDNSTGYRI